MLKTIYCLIVLLLTSVTAVRSIALDTDSGLAERGALFGKLPNTELSNPRALSPQDALRALRLPEGFQATMFASEPLVRQPISMTTDARGRLWVAENYTYSEGSVGFHASLRDRIVILEDLNQDGQADRRTVFWDQAQKLTSIEVGLGGVWALCPPHLIFIPDANHDDQPDGEPVVMLDGWDDGGVRHNVVNGLRWGPDGWLYGRHGILRTSRVGAPGVPLEQRQAINCGIWRFHPVQREFQVVAHGTTNSWGMDWDEHGQMFFINTVIGHLWHVVPGAHYERMFGEDFNPHVYDLMPQTADHVHWDTQEKWVDIRKIGVTPTTDEAGGGHAHAGLMVYQGDNWPDVYRGRVFAINFHGRRINQDVLRRQGASYTASHAPDLLRFGDPWFRGIDLLTGADGGVFVSDWSDTGECHDDDGIHRESGRIYKITYGAPLVAGPVNLATLPETELVGLLTHKNVWYARQAQTELYGRIVSGQDVAKAKSALRELYASTDNVVHRLRALACLHLLGAVDSTWLAMQLGEANEHLRVRAVMLLCDRGELLSEFARTAVLKAAESDPSGLVLLFLASGLQRLPVAERWQLGERLVVRAEFASDPAYVRMVWYGLEEATIAMPEQAVSLVSSARLPLVRRNLVRRLASNLRTHPEPLAVLAEQFSRSRELEWRRDVLEGIAAALQGWHKADAPPGWQSLLQELARQNEDPLREIARELLVVFGDGRTLEDLKRLAAAEEESIAVRRSAVRSLVASRADGLAPLLQQLLTQRGMAGEALRGLATIADPKTPELIVNSYERLDPHARMEAITTLTSRATYAVVLLNAVADGTIGRRDVAAFEIRQMASLRDERLERLLQSLWPEHRPASSEKENRLAELRELLSESQIAAANRGQGRAVFERSCAVCHTLFGNGKNIGPDLTGSQRTNLNYLLQNIVDPSAQLAENYRMSIVSLADGRVVNGVVLTHDQPNVRVQTPTELLSVPREDIERIVASELSLMPERLLDVLASQQIVDLFAYLMSSQQVALPQPLNGQNADVPVENP